MWNESVFWGRPTISPRLISLIPNLTSGCTRQHFGIMYFTFSCYFFIFDFFFKTFLIALLFLHLDIEAFKLFDVIISNFGLTVKEVLDMISLSSYIQQWRLVVWETCFFQKFKPKDAVLQKHGFYAPSKVITMIVESHIIIPWGQENEFRCETHSHKWGRVQGMEPNDSQVHFHFGNCIHARVANV